MGRKMDQIQQGLWEGLKGPIDGAKGYSLLQELERARKVDYFSSISIFFVFFVFFAWICYC